MKWLFNLGKVKIEIVVNIINKLLFRLTRKSSFFIILFYSLILGGWRSASVYAQDPHFSQFFYSPLTVNPANTGVFNGDIRASSMYRMQWSTVTSPFKTTSIAIDAPVSKGSLRRNDFFSMGLNIVNDNQGSAGLTTNVYNLLGSYTKYTGGDRSSYLSFGYELGYGMKTAGLGSLKYDSQYDPNTGGYSSTMGVNEQYTSTAQFIDMSSGLVWNYSNERKSRNSLGVSIHHLTAPNVSILGKKDTLLRKFSFQWNGAYAIGGRNTNAELLPSFMIAKQGGSLLINAGASIKFLLQQRSRYTSFHNERSMSAGLYYRYKDAAYVNLRFDIEDFSFGVAYDINISGLTPASKAVGSFEGMLLYRGVFGNHKMSKRSSTQFL
jgi:type IX secretion system PorP/SprF family membrane protein